MQTETERSAPKQNFDIEFYFQFNVYCAYYSVGHVKITRVVTVVLTIAFEAKMLPTVQDKLTIKFVFTTCESYFNMTLSILFIV